MARYKIHFTDNYGPATIEAETDEQYGNIMSNLKADATAENIWCEYWDEEEGWQA